MWDWLSAPIDPTRTHEISEILAWHGRSMAFAWGFLAPLAIIIARFFKVLPGQDWPRELDSPVWWRSHWMGQSGVLLFTALGFWLVLPADPGKHGLHAVLGYTVLAGLLAQVLLGVFRGNKGGPTALDEDGSPRGHHYDMTPRRRLFEALHKSLGYALLMLGVVTIYLGLWKVNAPIWMWLGLSFWWLFLSLLFGRWQGQGLAVDTYQAIWGDDPSHPGNQLPTPGWGVRRPGEVQERAPQKGGD